ncbi:hypothetical protein IAU59_002203 [Kwoniella sp. CBS 9459]
MVHRIFLPPPNEHLAPFPLPTSPESPTKSRSDEKLSSPSTRACVAPLVFHKLDPPTNYLPGFGLGFGVGCGSQALSLSLPLIERVNLWDRTWVEFSQGGLDSLERSTVSRPVPEPGPVPAYVHALHENSAHGVGEISVDENRYGGARGNGRGDLSAMDTKMLRRGAGKTGPGDLGKSSAGRDSLLASAKEGEAHKQNEQAEQANEKDIANQRETDRRPVGDETTEVDISVQDISALSNRPAVVSQKRKEDTSRDTSRRRSRRLTRQSASFLSALPHLEPSPSPNSPSQSSFDSLDTTTNSAPSQLATNPGNTSVSHFPRWSIPLHKLVSLQSVLSASAPTFAPAAAAASRSGHAGARLCTLIACVISTEPLVQRQRKEEKARGAAGSLWIGKWMIIAPPPAQQGARGQGEVTTAVRLWDELAREWGEKVRRGDVVLLENIEYKPTTSKEPAHLSLSSHHSAKITILYRTLPRYQPSTSDYIYQPPRPHQPRLGMIRATTTTAVNLKPQAAPGKTATMRIEDRMLRPDLRVGRSDAGVKRVEGVVRWFAEWIGGEGPV